MVCASSSRARPDSDVGLDLTHSNSVIRPGALFHRLASAACPAGARMPIVPGLHIKPREFVSGSGAGTTFATQTAQFESASGGLVNSFRLMSASRLEPSMSLRIPAAAFAAVS